MTIFSLDTDPHTHTQILNYGFYYAIKEHST